MRRFDLDRYGRRLHGYDAGGEGFPVVWCHGTPNIGAPPEPLFPAAERLGLRWVGYDRPGYGGSSAVPGRDVASAAGDVAAVMDALGVERFGVFGHSGGGPHALACGALLGDRVAAVVSVAGLAPFGATGLDWFGGMVAPESLRASAAGRAAKEAYEGSDPEFDLGMFTAADHAALAGPWAWFHSVVGPAMAHGPEGLIEDDLAYVTPWGFDPALLPVPVLLVHGSEDRIVPASHGEWLAGVVPGAEFWRRSEDGHISVLGEGEAALGWVGKRVSENLGG